MVRRVSCEVIDVSLMSAGMLPGPTKQNACQQSETNGIVMDRVEREAGVCTHAMDGRNRMSRDRGREGKGRG